MTKETKDFFSKYWQAVVIAISINIIVGIITNIGAYKVILYKVDKNMQEIAELKKSNKRLEMNQTALSRDLKIELPYKFD